MTERDYSFIRSATASMSKSPEVLPRRGAAAAGKADPKIHDVKHGRHRKTPQEEISDFGITYWRSTSPTPAELEELCAERFPSSEFERLADNIPILCWLARGDGYIVWYNRLWYEYSGTTPKEMEGWGWQSVHDPKQLPSVLKRWEQSIATGEPFEMTFPLRGADGVFRPFLTRVQPLRDLRGNVVRWFGVNTDVSDRVKAETALRQLNQTLENRVSEEVANRLQAEERLRQAQKMEAVGQLTGGVAHDFNNLLTLILGGLDTLKRSESYGDPRLRRAIDMALQASDRAASLTARLLAFSRRQPLSPKPLKVNALVRDMTELLHRTLGEQMELEVILSQRLWLVEVDQNQLESSIINLALNARDAAPSGGKLTIETANAMLDENYVDKDREVIPGQYVMLAVSDTGSGMSKEVVKRAFEPFFTTKESGRGTGLGLSMVYGFVKQSGGHVTIYSELSEGTTVKLYFPRFRGAPETRAAPAPNLAREACHDEVILVVEDNDDVRAYSLDVIKGLGFKVLEAANADDAMQIIETALRIDLLFTDVVLPGKNGRLLAEEARTKRPGLNVLYTTGYSRNAIIHQGRLDPGISLITKPFTREQLAESIRKILDRV
jgi:PAS domain S-box-containing protein